MDSVLLKAGLNNNDTIFSKIVHLLAYADNIEIIGRTKREFESVDMNLTMNEGKTICILYKSRDMRGIGYQFTSDICTLDIVNEFV